MPVKSIVKVCIKNFLLLFLFLILSTVVFGQQQLKLIHPENQRKVIIVKEGTPIGIKYADSSMVGTKPLGFRKRKRLDYINGRVEMINDSTITIHKSYSKKRITLKLENIYSIRKETTGKYIVLGICTAAFCSVYFTWGIPLPTAILIFFPTLHIYDLIFPYQTITYPFLNRTRD